jgi:hypothetical protein
MNLRALALPLAVVIAQACVERGDVLVPPDRAPMAGAGGSFSGSAGSYPEGAGGAPGGAGGSGGSGGEAGSPAKTTLAASEVRAGEQHTCAVYAGAAYCWGGNVDGQLGLGDTLARTVPTRLPGDRVWRRLTLGEAHSCGLDDLGLVHCWGSNSRGQLGQGDREARNIPALVDLPSRAVAVSADFDHSCALLGDFRLFCWGNNYEGQLGQGDPFPGEGSNAADGLSPLEVGGFEWSAVDAGQGHTCAIALDGALYCWGRNTASELGTEPNEGQIRIPTRVGTDSDWLDVDAGQHHTCGVREDLSLWCWGQNTASQADEGYPLGIAGAEMLTEPTAVEGDGYRLVRTNTFHTCALRGSSDLYAWGRNIEGQLGLGNTDSEPTPVFVDSDYAAVSVARFTTCALTTSGVVKCAGKNVAGELGTGDLERRNDLTEVLAPTD